MSLTLVSLFDGIGWVPIGILPRIAVPVFEWVAHRIVRVDAEVRGVANA